MVLQHILLLYIIIYLLFYICMLVYISILFRCLSLVVGSGNRKNSWWFPAVYQWEEGWVISAEGCRWQNESSWTECGETEAVDGLLVPSVGCRWLSGMCEILTMKCLFHTSASRGLTPSFWTILCPQSFQIPSFSVFHCHFVLHTTRLLLPWCFASHFCEDMQSYYIYLSLCLLTYTF